MLRAAADRNVQLMLPLVTRVDEVTGYARSCSRRSGARSCRDGVPRGGATCRVGVMIETPAAVLIADQLAEVSDFFSVGSNDLTQYTLAVDRGNARLAERFTPHHPAVVRQLAQIVAAAATPRHPGRASAARWPPSR